MSDAYEYQAWEDFAVSPHNQQRVHSLPWLNSAAPCCSSQGCHFVVPWQNTFVKRLLNCKTN
jgi:hypothetical protein